MKPLSYFIDTEFSRKVMAEYGDYLELLRPEITWLADIAKSSENKGFFQACVDNAGSEAYTRGQRTLFCLAFDAHGLGNVDRFCEVLEEYS